MVNGVAPAFLRQLLGANWQLTLGFQSANIPLGVVAMDPDVEDPEVPR
jgi:hypothetical protein